MSDTFWMCPVCRAPLCQTEGLSLKCPNGHNFDRAKKGAVYLLPSNRKHARLPGDNPEMVRARRDFLRKEHYAHLLEALTSAVLAHLPENGTLLDCGCGEGYYTEHLFRSAQGRGVQFFGVDISKSAANAAAKSCPEVQYAVASAFHLPVQDGSCDVLLSVFSPYCGSEFLRVLKPDGIFIMAIPAAKHLWELKAAVYDTPYENAVKDYALEGFTFLDKRVAEREITLGSAQEIADLFQMTPYAYRTGAKERGRLAALETLTTRAAFEVLVYRKENSPKTIKFAPH